MRRINKCDLVGVAVAVLEKSVSLGVGHTRPSPHLSLGLQIRAGLSYFSSTMSNDLTSKTMSKPPVNMLSLIRVAWVKVSLHKRAVTKTVST